MPIYVLDMEEIALNGTSEVFATRIEVKIELVLWGLMGWEYEEF